MNVKDLIPNPSDRVLFQASSIKLLEPVSGCYVLSTFEGFILYVGLTVDLKVRFDNHVGDEVKRGTTADGRAFWFYFFKCDFKDLQKIERTWQNDFKSKHGRNPILNHRDSPIS